MSATRLSKLKQYMQEQQFSAVAVNAGPTLTYLTGLHFHLMERPVVLVLSSDDEPTIILPELELATCSSQCGCTRMPKIQLVGPQLLLMPSGVWGCPGKRSGWNRGSSGFLSMNIFALPAVKRNLSTVQPSFRRFE